MTKKKPTPLLLADDIALEPDRETRSNAVKTCAGKIALKLGTSIDLVHVEDLLLYPVHTSRYKPLIERYFKERREKLAAVARSLGVPAKALFLNGDPVRKILSLTAKRDAYEMVILGTHGRKGLNRLILGSVAEEIIRQANIPVMVVGPKAQERASSFLSGKKITVLVPTSLTPNSFRAEEYGVALAKRLRADVVFFHNMLDALHPVLQTAFSVPMASPQVLGFFEEVKRTSIRKLDSKVKKASGEKVSASYRLEDRMLSSSGAILKEERRSCASVIVMGTHGRSLVSGAFFGRTARDVILASSVPVVTMHSRRS